MKNLNLFTVLLVTLLGGVESGRCFYNPQPGRWLNRGPIAEKGGMALAQNSFVFSSQATLPPALPPGAMALQVEREYTGGYGSTECDPATGKNVIKIVEHCAGNCVEVHEGKHDSDTSACCALYAKCYASHPANENACTDAYASYVNNNRDWLECNAFTAEEGCMEFLLRRLNLQKRCDETCKFNIQLLLSGSVRLRKTEHCSKAGSKPSCPFDSDGQIK